MTHVHTRREREEWGGRGERERDLGTEGNHREVGLVKMKADGEIQLQANGHHGLPATTRC